MGFLSKLKQSLGKTSNQIAKTVGLSGDKVDATTLENLEEALILADVGSSVAAQLVATLKNQRFDATAGETAVKQFLAQQIADILAPCATPFTLPTAKPGVILMVGVNGSGKTTTLGKLAAQLSAQGTAVLMAAGDTFRAGAVQQLQIWSERANVPIVAPAKEGADPAGLIFNAMEQAEQQALDVVLADTAGRLQNRQDLMEELAKIIRVIQKKDASAPHEVLLVLDATVGQNALQQVTLFKEIAGVTGLVITKLDSSAKAGIVVALAQQTGLPIYFIGVGEALEDLQPFDATAFAEALVGIEE